MSGKTEPNTDNQVFNNAAMVEAKKLTDLGEDELLELYGLYKTAVGLDITKVPAPGMFDFTEKRKRSGWQKQIDLGFSTPEKAQAQYIKRVEELKKERSIE